MEQAANDLYLFGKISIYRAPTYDNYFYKHDNSLLMHRTFSNVTDYSSTVFAVSEKYAWEQEVVRFKFQMKNHTNPERMQ